jgi:hypothetical protein
VNLNSKLAMPSVLQWKSILLSENINEILPKARNTENRYRVTIIHYQTSSEPMIVRFEPTEEQENYGGYVSEEEEDPFIDQYRTAAPFLSRVNNQVKVIDSYAKSYVLPTCIEVHDTIDEDSHVGLLYDQLGEEAKVVLGRRFLEGSVRASCMLQGNNLELNTLSIAESLLQYCVYMEQFMLMIESSRISIHTNASGWSFNQIENTSVFEQLNDCVTWPVLRTSLPVLLNISGQRQCIRIGCIIANTGKSYIPQELYTLIQGNYSDKKLVQLDLHMGGMSFSSLEFHVGTVLPVPVIDVTQLWNLARRLGLVFYDPIIQELMDSGRIDCISIAKARRICFIPCQVVINDTINFQWPVFAYNIGSSPSLQVGAFFKTLFPETWKSVVITPASITKLTETIKLCEEQVHFNESMPLAFRIKSN